jgi:ubiquinone/menaquinone biosynthesis C-methylase UbiE
MAARDPDYIPAAGHDRLLPLYDPFLRWCMREHRFKGRLVEEARIPAGARVLDLGCGTGTLAILIQRRHPDAAVRGLDGDPKVLALARAKAAREGVDAAFEEGLAYALPYPDGAFDRVLSSLVLHHLAPPRKLETLREVRRVLRSGGSFHVVDFGPPASAWARFVAHLALHGEHVDDHLAGRLPELLRLAGFEEVRESAPHATIAGSLHFVHATRA